MSDPFIYLVNPKSSFPHFYSLEAGPHFLGTQMAPFGELSLVTLAAMVPSDLGVRLCDEQISSIDWHPPEPVVGLTGKSNQVERTLELARHYRSLGKTVVIGGPYASLAPEVYQNECDVLVTGEIEEIYPKLFQDLREGKAQGHYQGNKADLSQSVLPRWDLYPNELTTSGTLQTSRGCPFSCEFCDVIQYAGKKQRHKSESQVIRELQCLYDHGYRQIFICDDNFTSSRKRAKALLSSIAEWNGASGRERVLLFTQLSIDACHDQELLDLMSLAGLHRSFVGIETVNTASLKETHKFQNLRGGLLENTEKLLRSGVAVYAGLIFGFDNDSLDTFQQQAEFLNSSPIVAFSAGALIAYRSTPLFQRWSREGRIDSDISDGKLQPWQTNVKFKNFSQSEFEHSYLEFIKDVYSAKNFSRRMSRAIELFGQDNAVISSFDFSQATPGCGEAHFGKLLQVIGQMGAEESAMLERFFSDCGGSTLKLKVFGKYLYCFLQVRYMFREAFAHSELPIDSMAQLGRIDF